MAAEDRGAGLYPSEDQQHDQDGENEAEAAARKVTPVDAVRPNREGSESQQHEQDDQQQSHMTPRFRRTLGHSVQTRVLRACPCGARCYLASSAVFVIARPVEEMSFPTPDVVLQALSRIVPAESTSTLIKIVAKFLRIGGSFGFQCSQEQYC